MKIGILGGTFDPIHEGHLLVAKNAKRQYSLDKVIFIPVFSPPHKEASKSSASPGDRFRMVKLVLEGEADLEVSDLEIKRQGVSYTIDTLKALKIQCPQASFFLILGMDAFKEFDSWHHAHEIRQFVKFLVAKRQDSERREELGKEASWIEIPLCPFSSSRMREILKKSKNAPEGLPQKAFNYIQTHKLYGAGAP